jgi:hypothetical protein
MKGFRCRNFHEEEDHLMPASSSNQGWNITEEERMVTLDCPYPTVLFCKDSPIHGPFTEPFTWL